MGSAQVTLQSFFGEVDGEVDGEAVGEIDGGSCTHICLVNRQPLFTWSGMTKYAFCHSRKRR